MKSELEQALSLPGANREPIYLEAYRKLRKLIAEGVFPKGEKLPGEAQLAEMMNIGRTSLRTALVLLYEDGYIVTQHGRGTFVTYEPGQEADEFPAGAMTLRRRLELTGRRVTVEQMGTKPVLGDAFLDEKLAAGGGELTMMSFLYALDDKPAVLSQMFFQKGLAGTLEELETIFDASVTSVTNSFTATAVAKAPFSVPRFNEAKNVLLISCAWYDASRTPICFTKDYMDNDICRYKITQNK